MELGATWEQGEDERKRKAGREESSKNKFDEEKERAKKNKGSKLWPRAASPTPEEQKGQKNIQNFKPIQLASNN